MTSTVQRYLIKFNLYIAVILLLVVGIIAGIASEIINRFSIAIVNILGVLAIFVILEIIASVIIMKTEPKEDTTGMKVFYSTVGLGIAILLVAYIVSVINWG